MASSEPLLPRGRWIRASTGGECKHEEFSEISQNKVARALALAHYQLSGPLRYNFVYNYLDESIAGNEDFNVTGALHFQCRIITLLVGGCVLPWIYSNFIQSDGCREAQVYIYKNATQMSNMTSNHSEYYMINVHCSTQIFLKSAWSLLLGPCVLSLAMVCETIVHRVSPRTMLLLYPLLDIITPQIWKLKYHQEPVIYARVSQAFALLMLEMAVIGVCLRSPATLVVGYAVGRLLLLAASIVLAPEPGCISILEGELRSWCDDAGLQDFFVRLRDHRNVVLALTEVELHALMDAMSIGGRLEKLSKDAENSELSFVKSSGWLLGATAQVERRRVYFTSLYLKDIYILHKRRDRKTVEVHSPRTSPSRQGRMISASDVSESSVSKVASQPTTFPTIRESDADNSDNEP